MPKVESKKHEILVVVGVFLITTILAILLILAVDWLYFNHLKPLFD